MFLAVETVSRSGVIRKANMMYLSKEAINKDQSLKMQLLLSGDDKATLDTELVWKKMGFLEIEKESTINKENFSENPLVYANQGSKSTLVIMQSI